MPVLVVGVGNRYRRDDGAGLIAAARLGASARIPVTLLESTADAAALLDLWRGMETVIVFDAMQSGGAPGAVRRLDAIAQTGTAQPGATLPMGLATAGSTHGLGVAAAVALARTLNGLPRRLIIIGIEGAHFDAGVDLSPAVEGALDEAVRIGLAEVGDVHRAAR